MKGNLYYFALLELSKIIKKDSNLQSVINKLISDLNKYKEKKISYEEVVATYTKYIEEHTKISNALAKIQDKYYIEIYNTLKVFEIFGNTPINTFNESLNKYGLHHIAYLSQILQVISKNNQDISYIIKFIDTANLTLTNLRQMQYTEFKAQCSNQLVFLVKVNGIEMTFKELQKTISDWDKILQTLKRISLPDSPDPNYIYSVDDGSFLISIVAAIPTIYLALQCIEKLYDIRLKRQMVLKEIKYNQIFEGLPQETLEEFKKHKLPEFNSEKLASELISSYNIENKGENLNELKGFLANSIEKIYHYIENNGEIILLKESKDEIEENNNNNPEIKELLTISKKLIEKQEKYIQFIESKDILYIEKKDD